jgi:hypothetical protein
MEEKIDKRIKHNFIGKRFGRLVILERVYTDTKPTKVEYLCECDCGNKIITNQGNLTRKRQSTKSCGCLRRDLARSRNREKHVNWKGCGKIPGSYLSRIKSSAAKKCLEFNLDINYLSELFDNQNGKCIFTGRGISFGETNKDERTASLDRIDSTEGYLKGNVQWVHKEINDFKSNYTDEEFINLCKEIVEYRKIS